VASREDIRSAAFPLFVKQGVAQTTAAQVADAAGISESRLAAEFTEVRDILLQNDHYQRMLETFVAEPAELSPSAAWIVAIEETASRMDAGTWQRESTRQHLILTDPVVGEHAVPLSVHLIALTRTAVSTRTGLPADSPKVGAFAGALIGALGTMPSGDFDGPPEWIAAQAQAVEALGPSLDKLLL